MNDFPAALAAAGALVEVAAGQCPNWVDEDDMLVSTDHLPIAIEAQDIRGLLERSLAAVRKAAAPYPLESRRLIGNLARLVATRSTDSEGLRAFLRGYGRQVHDLEVFKPILAQLADKGGNS